MVGKLRAEGAGLRLKAVPLINNELVLTLNIKFGEINTYKHLRESHQFNNFNS